jgi:hypothetical protein
MHAEVSHAAIQLSVTGQASGALVEVPTLLSVEVAA